MSDVAVEVGRWLFGGGSCPLDQRPASGLDTIIMQFDDGSGSESKESSGYQCQRHKILHTSLFLLSVLARLLSAQRKGLSFGESMKELIEVINDQNKRFVES